MRFRSFTSPLGAALLVGFASLPAQAALYTPTFGPLLPGYVQNDDATFAGVSLGFNINFFGTDYNTIFINNNGNATFGGATASFSPIPLDSQLTRPMIAPFWADLDSRDGGPTSGIHVTQTAHQMVVTWQDMGFFSRDHTGQVTFQLVLNDPSAPIAPGEGVIGFFYGRMTSAGSFGPTPATAGFGDGREAINPGEIAYFSGETPEGAARLNDTEVWFNLDDGTPVALPPPVTTPIPEPETYALMLAGLAVVGAASRRRKTR